MAQLVGLAVFGPDGEPIGKVRDVVAALRVDASPPRVLGMVVELATRRRIFVPMLRVTAIDPDAVTLATGSVNLRRFHQRPNEVLRGRPAARRPGHSASRPATERVVVDAAIEPTRTRDWVLGRSPCGSAGRLGRRGPVQVLPWSEVPGLPLSPTRAPRALLAVFETMRAADVATALHELPAKRRYEVVDALDDERLADVIEELSEDDQRDCSPTSTTSAPPTSWRRWTRTTPPTCSRAVRRRVRTALLELMEPEESAPVRRLLELLARHRGRADDPGADHPPPGRHGGRGAGAGAQPRHHAGAGQHGVRVPAARRPTPTGRYLGCVHIQRLLREPPFDLVAGVRRHRAGRGCRPTRRWPR